MFPKSVSRGLTHDATQPSREEDAALPTPSRGGSSRTRRIPESMQGISALPRELLARVSSEFDLHDLASIARVSGELSDEAQRRLELIKPYNKFRIYKSFENALLEHGESGLLRQAVAAVKKQKKYEPESRLPESVETQIHESVFRRIYDAYLARDGFMYHNQSMTGNGPLRARVFAEATEIFLQMNDAVGAKGLSDIAEQIPDLTPGSEPTRKWFLQNFLDIASRNSERFSGILHGLSTGWHRMLSDPQDVTLNDFVRLVALNNSVSKQKRHLALGMPAKTLMAYAMLNDPNYRWTDVFDLIVGVARELPATQRRSLCNDLRAGIETFETYTANSPSNLQFAMSSDLASAKATVDKVVSTALRN